MTKINIIILAAGYGTRLSTQIQNLKTENPQKFKKYENLLNLPKALLPIKKKPLLTYWVEYLLTLHATCEESSFSIEKFIIVTNNKFQKQLTDWWSKLCCTEGRSHIRNDNDLNKNFCKSHVHKVEVQRRLSLSQENEETLLESPLEKLTQKEIQKYMNKLVEIEILNDNTNDNEERLGCNGSIKYAFDRAIPVEVGQGW